MALPKCAELFNSLLNVLKTFDGKSGKILQKATELI